MEITKEQLLFSRGEGGKLIPQETELKGIEGAPTVKIVPLTRGKLQEVYALAVSENVSERSKADSLIISSGLISPVLTEEEIDDMKPQMSTAIAQSILSISLGMSQEEFSKKVNESTADNIALEEYKLKKK